MEHPDTQKQMARRLLVLALLIIGVLLAYFAVMFNIQIVHGEEYVAQSISQIVRTTTVEAARGNITDRNGNLLVGNRQTYTLTFDASLLPDDVDQNEAILRLVNLCIENNIDYTDNVPLTQNAPFTYVTLTDTQQNLFNRYLTDTLQPYLETQLKRRKADLEAAENSKDGEPLEADAFLDDPTLDVENLTAPQLMEAMRRSFGIDDSISDADARKIMAVRWELALRATYATTAYVLANDVNINLITLIKDGDYYGADIGLASTRQYYTTAAAHILGEVGNIGDQYEELKDQGYSINDTVGKTGVEAAFEEYLRGVNGTRISNTNDEGKVTSELYTKEPQPGDTVELTLDLEFQKQVEQLLAEKVAELNAEDGLVDRGAAAVVLDIKTRDVLAIASCPTFDLESFHKLYNEYAADPANPLWNRATSGLYAPGSTLKPLTAIAALEEGAVTTTEKIRDTGKWVYPGDPNSFANCWYRSGHGLLNVTGAITNSCNYFFAEMGYRLGMDTFREYLTAFGLGESTGIETGDYTGTLPQNAQGENQAPWAAFGQANQLYTPIQLANYIATLVSGGEHYQTHLLKRVISYDNSEIVYEAEPTLLNTIDIDVDNLDAVLKGMLGYTQSGGQLYSYFQNCIVTAGAKTGTAQLGGDSENNGVFVCFAPYDDPEIAVALVIEKGGAGAVLAETAVGILNAYFAEDEIAATIIGENELLS